MSKILDVLWETCSRLNAKRRTARKDLRAVRNSAFEIVESTYLP